jgi:hypothetical protein
MATWDLKSGYFHVPIHLDFWNLFLLHSGRDHFLLQGALLWLCPNLFCV